jgi:hypothetical protein
LNKRRAILQIESWFQQLSLPSIHSTQFNLKGNQSIDFDAFPAGASPIINTTGRSA